jgi:SPP1 family predicted phage head-tail adaptor
MIASGRLNRPITIEAQSTAPDSFGQPQQTWATVLSTWAGIGVVTSKEVYALGAGFTSQVTHKITMRFPTPAITTAMRVVYRGRTFIIQTVSDPDEDRREMHLICLEQMK